MALYTASTGATETLTKTSAFFGFNAQATRVALVSAGDQAPFTFIRSLGGGPDEEQPLRLRGWLAEDVVVIHQDEDVLVRTVDGRSESIIWTETPEEHLLLLIPPRNVP